MKITSLGLALFVIAAGSPAWAGEDAPSAAQSNDDGFFKDVLKRANMATDDLGHPQDFVVKSRPSAPSDYVPVFRKNDDHKTKVLTPDQLKAMGAELDAASQRTGRIRDAFPPARKAYQEEQREKAAKAAAKHEKSPATTATQ